MKTIYKIAAMLVASVVLLSSCHKRGECIELPEEGVLRVTSSDIQWLRTAGNSWVENDAIGVFAFTSGQTLSETSLFDSNANIKFVTKGNGQFVHESTAVKLPSVNSVDLVAYYPFNESVENFTYSFNNSDQSDLAKIDLLYANNAKGLSATKSDANMNFFHMLTSIIIELNPNGAELVAPVMAIEGALVDGSMSLVDGVVTTGSTKANPTITMPKANAKGLMIGEMILPPQTYDGNKITLKIGDKPLSGLIPNFTTKSGFRYILKVNYVKEGAQGTAELRVDSSTIKDWNTDPEVDIPEMDINDKVTVEVVEVKVTPEAHTMNVGESLTLGVTVSPDNASDKSVVWSSNAPDIASVENAVVKALAAGTAVITAKSANGKEGSCTVTVKEVNPDKSIPDVPGENL